MDVLKIKEAHVLGNSLGAQIATLMAMQAPQRVQSLILIAQNPPIEVRRPYVECLTYLIVFPCSRMRRTENSSYSSRNLVMNVRTTDQIN